jgi:RNA polymerase sigma-70 factor (ECF subfamily)
LEVVFAIGVVFLQSTDYELVKECLEGDRGAFAEIVERYKRLIYSVVYNMIRDKDEVQDISQEVFVRIYKALGRYNPQYKFSTWSVKIATNLCLDILRKKKIDSAPIEEIESYSDKKGIPEDKFVEKERNEIIRNAVQQLPEKYRVPVVLFHQNGMSYNEMTEILGEPITIIKNRLYRARKMLKEKLLPELKEEVL